MCHWVLNTNKLIYIQSDQLKVSRIQTKPKTKLQYKTELTHRKKLHPIKMHEQKEPASIKNLIHPFFFDKPDQVRGIKGFFFL